MEHCEHIPLTMEVTTAEQVQKQRCYKSCFSQWNLNHSTRYLSSRFWCFSLLIAGYEASLLTAPACCTSNVLFKPMDRIFFFRQRYGTALRSWPPDLRSDLSADCWQLWWCSCCVGQFVFSSFRPCAFFSVVICVLCSVTVLSVCSSSYIFFHTCTCIYT